MLLTNAKNLSPHVFLNATSFESFYRHLGLGEHTVCLPLSQPYALLIHGEDAWLGCILAAYVHWGNFQ